MTEPWKVGPDRVDWIDAATGFKCYAQRCFIREDPVVGGWWCGYVVAPFPLEDVYVFDVHGGVTFDAADDENNTVLGFDCAHCDDFMPGLSPESEAGQYKDLAYVQEECRRLAEQIFLQRKP